MRIEDRVRDQYNTLLTRYIRHAAEKGLKPDVADGLAPIPAAWLKAQPEIKRDPTLLASLQSLNDR
jgi:hypothetical protein